LVALFFAVDEGGVFAGVRDLDLGAAAACFVFGVDTTMAPPAELTKK